MHQQVACPDYEATVLVVTADAAHSRHPYVTAVSVKLNGQGQSVRNAAAFEQ